jgi:dTDP-L-rhamnose 4-epimerase
LRAAMRGRALITGGAGFIGSHLADELLAAGYDVRALDCLAMNVHGTRRERPDYLAPDVELVVADVRDRDAVANALRGVDVVFHLAARVGVGQSMFQIAEYTAANNLGTAVLVEALIQRPVRRLVVASSMSVYGEGLYRDVDGKPHPRARRHLDQLARGRWDPIDDRGRRLVAVPTPESKPPDVASLYALSKFDQERMCLLAGSAYNIPTVALRLFNVYGARQALSNPYTGVLAMFAARLLNGNAPVLFEDGDQLRDFVHVRDVARACRLALDGDAAVGRAFNVASGQAVSIRDLAERMARVLGLSLAPEITGQYRIGDVRHCTADIAAARSVLGYRPTVELENGLIELAEWLATQQPIDRVDTMRQELIARGLAL